MSKQRLMQRRPDTDQAEAAANPALLPAARELGPQATATAPLAGHSFSQLSVLAPQAKMTVNTPGDSFEQEADAVAASVMRSPDPAPSSLVQRAGDEEEELQMKEMPGASPSRILQRESEGPEEEEEQVQTKPAVGEVSSLVQRSGEEEEELQMKEMPGAAPVSLQRAGDEEEEMQMKEDGPSSGKADVSGVVSAGLSGGGQGLDSQTRSFMEPRFGHDFSQVKVHTDAQASQSAESVAARAYTVGGDIAFRSGQYEPGTSEGKRLLAHELTHVVQQGAAGKAVQNKSEQTED